MLPWLTTWVRLEVTLQSPIWSILLLLTDNSCAEIDGVLTEHWPLLEMETVASCPLHDMPSTSKDSAPLLTTSRLLGANCPALNTVLPLFWMMFRLRSGDVKRQGVEKINVRVHPAPVFLLYYKAVLGDEKFAPVERVLVSAHHHFIVRAARIVHNHARVDRYPCEITQVEGALNRTCRRHVGKAPRLVLTTSSCLFRRKPTARTPPRRR